jgi:hypothetical protein
VSRPTWALPTGRSPRLIATAVGGLFFPQSKSLGLDLAGTSPGLLKKIVYAGSNGPAFQRGSDDLRILAEVTVDAKQVERLSEQIGQERVAERDALVKAWLARPLAQREDAPPGLTAPGLAVVEMDGGRLQIRSDADALPDGGPPGPSEPGAAAVAASPEPAQPVVSPPASDPAAASPEPADGPTQRAARSKHWREYKTGCLLRMSSTVSDVDPCPEIPPVFVDPLQSLKLAQQIGHCAVPPGASFQGAEPEPDETACDEAERSSKRPGRPEVEARRVVASRQDVYHFGPLLAATACTLGLFAATRRAFVADGLSENWSVHKRYFARWTAVLDFVHALTYVYAAAMAGRSFAAGWPVYQRWIGWVWAGQVSGVIEELTARQQEVGQPLGQPPGEDALRHVPQAGLAADEQPRREHGQAAQLPAEGDGEVLDRGRRGGDPATAGGLPQ